MMKIRKKRTVLILVCLLLLLCGIGKGEDVFPPPDVPVRGTGLKEAVIGDQVTVIEAGAFADTGLELIYLPASVQEIGDGAFAGCGTLKAVASIAAASSSRAGSIRGEWKAPPTPRGRARLAPAALRAAHAAATASFSPEMTICPSQL